MKFLKKYVSQINKGKLVMFKDTSILFQNSEKVEELDYTVSLGSNSRYLLDLSHITGRCGNIRCFMGGNKILKENLTIPENKMGEIYFVSDEQMTAYSGDMYYSFKDDCYYDEKNCLLCIGNPRQFGEAVEFIQNVVAVIDNNELIAIYMKIESMKDTIVIKQDKICIK